MLSGGVLGGTGLVTGEVLEGGDELTNTELAFALLLRLVVPGIVIVQVGYGGSRLAANGPDCPY